MTQNETFLSFRYSFHSFYFRSQWKLTRAAARNDVTVLVQFFSLLIAAQRIRMWNYFELVIFYGLWMQLPPLPTSLPRVPFVSVCWCVWLALIELLIVIVIVIVAFVAVAAAAAADVVVDIWNMLLLLVK